MRILELFREYGVLEQSMNNKMVSKIWDRISTINIQYLIIEEELIDIINDLDAKKIEKVVAFAKSIGRSLKSILMKRSSLNLLNRWTFVLTYIIKPILRQTDNHIPASSFEKEPC